MKELSLATQKLIERYLSWSRSLRPLEGIPTLHVDEVASGVASFYEKIRGIIEWREEHLLRKTAIERILKRRLFLRKKGEKIAEPFVLELIRGGHFPNDAIPESKIKEIQKLIDKYVFILENAPQPPQEKEKIELFNWILGIAACEVEATLNPPLKEEALIDYMEELMKERIQVRKGGILVTEGMPEEEKNTQIFIAVRRALFKLDSPLITFHLLKRKYPQWSDLPPSLLEQISKNIYSIRENIEKELSHPLAEKFYNICERYDTPYLILGDIISKNPTEASKILANPQTLENSIEKAYWERLTKLKGKLKRAAIFCTISIFVTKILLALLLEIPFDIYITGQFSYPVLGINILLPPLLMFFLLITIRPPRKENLQKVIMEVMKIVYARERKDVYEIKIPKKRGVILNAIITTFYILCFLISFGLIVWILGKLQFGILSMAIFLMFVSLISFAGVKIRQRAKELTVEEEKETFLSMLFDFFSLPIIRMGKRLSAWWEKHNVLVVIFTALIDMPFQVFVEFLEQWRYFLKEKKEEIH